MKKKLTLLTIHGIRETERDYYTRFYDQIEKELGFELWQYVILNHLIEQKCGARN